jgi:hypothetical protein
MVEGGLSRGEGGELVGCGDEERCADWGGS